MAFSSKIRFTGCTIMTLGILLAGPVPVLLGFTATHIFSVDWPAGARLYPIWLFATNSAISVVALAFLWAYPVNRVFGITLAGLLGLCVYGGFWLSAVVVSFTSGILPDKNIWKVIGDNANILAFSMGLVLLLFGWFLSVRNERKAQ